MYNIDLTPPGQAAAQTIEARRQQIAARLNGERAARGARPLALDPALTAAAQKRAEESPPSPEEDIGRQVEAAGYAHRLASEIVILGGEDFVGGLEPRFFADAMDPAYRDLGVGLASGENGTTCVLVFGLSLAEDFAENTAALADLPRVREEILARVNAVRHARRLPPLRVDPMLQDAAQGHADDMIRRSYYGHDSPEGVGAYARARHAGYKGQTVAENIAEGQTSVSAVMEGWMGSPGHREHIVSPTLSEIGIGMAYGKNRRGYEIVWVQVFGTPPPPP